MSLSPEESAWRQDYAEYQRLVKEGYQEAICDTEKLQFLSMKYPNYDLIQSLKANMVMFWGTTEGWECKKRKKVKRLNMAATLINSVDYGHHLILKNNVKKEPTPYCPPGAPPVIEEAEERRNYHYQQKIIKIAAALFRLPDKVERSKKYHDGLTEAIAKGKEFEYVDAEYKKIAEKTPWALNSSEDSLFGESAEKKTVRFMPDAEERRKAFVAQYGGLK